MKDSFKLNNELTISEIGVNRAIMVRSTGQRIPSITSGVEIFEDAKEEKYFAKLVADGGIEINQLCFLRSFGIPTPKQILADESTTVIATSYGGQPLAIYYTGADKSAKEKLFYQSGILLSKIHSVLNQYPFPPDLLQCTYRHTAHIVDNFFYKNFNPVDLNCYQRYKQRNDNSEFLEVPNNQKDLKLLLEGPFIDLPDEGIQKYKQLINEANVLAKILLEKLRPYICFLSLKNNSDQAYPLLSFKDDQLFYGDFKGDNILVKGDCRNKLYIIDPIISIGNKIFDLAKFVSRTKLEGYDIDDGLFLHFYRGYGKIPDDRKKYYGPFQFHELVKLDMLNMLKSCAKRYARGDREYRIVKNLSDPKFCDRLCELLTKEKI